MEKQIAYISGVVDGEGCIMIGKYPRKGNKSLAYRAFFNIANTHVPLLEFLKSVMGGKIIEMKNKCFTLNFTANEIRNLIPQLLPHLIVKKKQAEVLLDFLEKQSNNASAPISDELLSFYEQSYQKMSRLKKERFDFKEKLVSLGFRNCETCGNLFEFFSNQSSHKKYCSIQCKKKMHWTRSNSRIRLGISAWNK